MSESILTGQGNYGPLPIPIMRGPMRYWRLQPSTPAALNMVIVYDDGTVLEGGGDRGL